LQTSEDKSRYLIRSCVKLSRHHDWWRTCRESLRKAENQLVTRPSCPTWHVWGHQWSLSSSRIEGKECISVANIFSVPARTTWKIKWVSNLCWVLLDHFWTRQRSCIPTTIPEKI
jgi:hypothetical protein